jgi:hypothetical protein
MTSVFHILLPILLIGGAMSSSPPFVPGEVLLRFVSGSAASSAVEAALQVTPPDLQALAPIVKTLQGAAHIPLKAIRVASGNWVVLNVEPGPLADQAARDLRKRKNIESVEVVVLEPLQQGLMPKREGLRVLFTSRSPESEIVSKKTSGVENKHVARLASELGKTVGLPLKGYIGDGDRLLLEIDLMALTPILVERLKALPDVEFAQPNYKVGFRPSP